MEQEQSILFHRHFIMKQILGDLVKKWWTDQLPTIEQRDVNLIEYFDPKIKKILSVVGFRRVGKTFTLLDFAAKFGKEKCVYINFEDERLPKKTAVLSALVDVITELKGQEPLVFLLDEIQEIPEWSMWARRINETTHHRLILSGSSSKLSSQEIPTELRGQAVTIPIFPLSWGEFLRFRHEDSTTLPHPQLLHLLREHLTIGGMPEIVLAEQGLRPLILTNYLNTFVDRDIIERYKLRNKEAFSDLLRLLPNTRNFTYSKLANTLNSFGHSIGKATLIRYLQWLESSFFLSHLELYSANVKTKVQSVKKAYLIDNYFSTHFGSTSSENLGHLMEQAVYNQLHVRSAWYPQYQTAYWKDYVGNEVDFLVSNNKSVDEVIQVTFANTLAEIPDREVRGLVKAAKQFNLKSGKIITWELEDRTEKDGIELIYLPIWKWLENHPSTGEV